MSGSDHKQMLSAKRKISTVCTGSLKKLPVATVMTITQTCSRNELNSCGTHSKNAFQKHLRLKTMNSCRALLPCAAS